MSALKSVLLAIDLATAQRDQMAQDLMNAQQDHQFAQDQMAQLQTYALETESRWTARAQIGTTPEVMRHHYQFMDRLQHAVGLQSGALENTGHKAEMAKKCVLEAEFRLVSLKQVLKKKQSDLLLLQSRREQKQMDEFASLSSSRAGAGYAAEAVSHEH